MGGKGSDIAALDEQRPESKENGIARRVESVDAEGSLGGDTVALEEGLGGEDVSEFVGCDHEGVVEGPLLTVVFEVERCQRDEGKKKKSEVTHWE